MVYCVLTDNDDMAIGIIPPLIRPPGGRVKLICKDGLCDIINNKRCNSIYWTYFQFRSDRSGKFNMFNPIYVPYYTGDPFYIRFVLLPAINNKLNFLTDPPKKLILSEKYYIYSYNIIKRFNIEVNVEYIKHACKIGDMRILEQLFTRNMYSLYQECASDVLNIASEKGNVHILEWWKNSCLPLKHDMSNLIKASHNEHINVLEWWKKSGVILNCNGNMIYELLYTNLEILEWWKNSNIPLLYTEESIGSVSYKGRVDLLEWWKNSGLILKYTEKAIDTASSYGYVNVLEWWKNSRLTLKYTEKAIDESFMSPDERIDILEWWLKSGLPLKYSEKAIDNASTYQNAMNILERWLKSGLPIKYTEKAIDYASALGYIDVLEWWLKSKLQLKYSEEAVDYASIHQRKNVLEWWLKSGLPLKYSEKAIDYATDNGYIDVLDWWLKSGLPIKYSEKAITRAHNINDINVLKWWGKSGLLLKYYETHPIEMNIINRLLMNH